MLTAREGEMLPLYVACLEGRLHQIRQEWSQLEQWEQADQLLMRRVQAQTEQVQALLDGPGSHDQQVRNALRELQVIGHVQRFLLEQAIQRGERERMCLQEEGDQAQQVISFFRHSTDPNTLV